MEFLNWVASDALPGARYTDTRAGADRSDSHSSTRMPLEIKLWLWEYTDEHGQRWRTRYLLTEE